MNHIGQRIKELRKKNDLTQEALADFLGITYKAVSKWECGLTVPDIALIVPMARLFHVTADELLGMNPVETDERKKYFDSEYEEFWKKDDHEADYLIAKQAVKEYPGDFRYLHWLGTVEYYISFNRQNQDEFMEMMDCSIKHNLTVYENSSDAELRNTALWNVICAYRYSDRINEAKRYAELYPETPPTGRDEAMALCLEGKELLAHQQKMVSDALAKLCGKLGNMWTFANADDPRALACVKAEKTIIETIIPDGNTLGFSLYLSGIHEKLAECALTSNDYDTAVKELKKAKEYAIAYDKAMTSGKQLYTCQILDHLDYDYTDCRPWDQASVDYLLERINEDKKYAPLREREDFKALLA